MPIEKPQRPGLRLLKQFLLGLPVGGAVGFVLARFDLLEWMEHWSGENALTLLLAVMLALTAALIAWATTSPARLRKLIGPRGSSEPLDVGALPAARAQAALLAVCAVTLVIPPVAQEMGWPAELRQAGMAAIIVLGLFCSWQSWRVYRLGDELVRFAIVSSAAAAYFFGSALLFAWACAAKLNLLPEVGSWAVMLAFTFVSLVCSVTIQLRRGLVPG